MPTSKRENILGSVEARLKTITVVNGYRNTVQPGSVRRVVAPPPGIHEFPSLFVIAGQEEALVGPEGGPIGLITYKLTVTVEGWVKGTPEALPGKVEGLLHDLRKAMLADYTHGGYAYETDDLGAEAPVLSDAGEGIAIVRNAWMIWYRTLYGDPSV